MNTKTLFIGLFVVIGAIITAVAQTGLLPPIPSRYDFSQYDIDPRVVAAVQIYPEGALIAEYEGFNAAQNWIDTEWERHGLRTEKLDFKSLIEEFVRKAPINDAVYYIRIRAELQGITEETDPIFYEKLKALQDAANLNL